MKSKLYMLSLLAAVLTISCGGEGKEKEGIPGDVWVRQAPRVSKVEVVSGETLLETFQYTYDETGRLKTLLKKDELSGEVLLDLEYTYPAQNQMRIQGKFFPISTNRFITVDYDSEHREFTYTGSWASGWTYKTTCDDAGVAVKTASDVRFAASGGQYTANTAFEELYAVEGGCIRSVTTGSQTEATGSHSTRVASEQCYSEDFTYTDNADRQNFSAYIMPGNFPVWIAAGIPGNKKLPAASSARSGRGTAVAYPETKSFEYSFDAAGNLQSAKRTDYNNSEVILVRTYKFFYE